MQQARVPHQTTGNAARVFTEFRYQTKKSWSCARRVVAAAYQTAKLRYLSKSNHLW
jgi:hypothetical protein